MKESSTKLKLHTGTVLQTGMLSKMLLSTVKQKSQVQDKWIKLEAYGCELISDTKILELENE